MKVSIVVTFLMCSGSEFQTEGPKQEKALTEWDFEEAGSTLE